jgi:hypothetical protein
MDWLRRVRNPAKLEEWWKVLGIELIGRYRYYGTNGNMQGIRRSTTRPQGWPISGSIGELRRRVTLIDSFYAS